VRPFQGRLRKDFTRGSLYGCLFFFTSEDSPLIFRPQKIAFIAWA
jgi:hypothetical protein